MSAIGVRLISGDNSMPREGRVDLNYWNYQIPVIADWKKVLDAGVMDWEASKLEQEFTECLRRSVRDGGIPFVNVFAIPGLNKIWRTIEAG